MEMASMLDACDLFLVASFLPNYIASTKGLLHIWTRVKSSCAKKMLFLLLLLLCALALVCMKYSVTQSMCIVKTHTRKKSHNYGTAGLEVSFQCSFLLKATVYQLVNNC